MLQNHNSMIKVAGYLILILLMTSCSHNYYIANTTNVPLLKEKEDFQATFSLGTGDKITTADFQAAYAFTDKFALMSNVMLARGADETIEEKGKGQSIELGVGYFRSFGEIGIVELYGGAGGSKQNHQYRNGGTASLSFSKVFIQPAIGLSTNVVDVAFTPSISTINFYKISNQIDPAGGEFMAVNEISNNRTSVLFEPALTVRLGWKELKLQMQAGLSQNLSNPYLSFETAKLSLGLTYGVHKRYHDKK